MCLGMWCGELGGRFRRVLKETKENDKITVEKRIIWMTKVRIK